MQRICQHTNTQLEGVRDAAATLTKSQKHDHTVSISASPKWLPDHFLNSFLKL